jgi:HemY protein
MLWSLIKIIVFVAIVAGLTIGAGILMETGPSVQLTVGLYEFNLGPLQAVIAALVLLAAIWLALKVAGFLVAVLRFLNGDDTAVSRYFDRNRERKGFSALADSMLALASGEHKVAMAKAAKAEKYLKRPELTDLVTAQAAEMGGDTRRAEETYKRLLGDERTRFVGIRGLLKQKLDQGDTATALKLAEKAFALKPKNAELQDTLLQLQATGHDWAGARTTLIAKVRNGSMPRDVHKRRDAVLALSQAREDDTEAANSAAIEANRLAPHLVPAAVMAARAYIAEQKPRYATNAIKAAWQKAPHPELAAAFAEIEPNETAEARLKRFQILTKLNAGDPETRMLSAELYLSAEDFPAARKALGDLYETDPTVRSLTIMAAIERGEGSEDHIVRAWLARALTAPRDSKWLCENCGQVHGDWVPICEGCGSFDTLSWKRPAEGSPSASAVSAQMLPLIVGVAKKKPEETDAVVAAEDTGTIDTKLADAPAK